MIQNSSASVQENLIEAEIPVIGYQMDISWKLEKR